MEASVPQPGAHSKSSSSLRWTACPNKRRQLCDGPWKTHFVVSSDSLRAPVKVIDPVQSLPWGQWRLRLDEICGVLMRVKKSERITLPPVLARRIAEQSSRNLRRAILMLEACKVRQYPFSEDQEVQTADWQEFLKSVALDLCTTQSPQQLLKVRGKLYELLTNCIPADVIIKELVKNLLVK